MVQHVAGRERRKAVAARLTAGVEQASRIVWAALVRQADMALVAEDVCHPAQLFVDGAVPPGHQRRHQPGGMIRDVLPMKKGPALLAPLRIGAEVAAGKQVGEPRPPRKRFGPDQQRRAADQIEAAAGDQADGETAVALDLLGRIERTHQPGDRVAVGNAERGHAHRGRGREQLLAARRAA